MTRILLSYVCRPSVGHVAEAMRYTRGLYEANPGAEIHLAMSDRGVPEVTTGCPWITRTYAIPAAAFDDPDVDSTALAPMPREWDYIVDDNNAVVEEACGVHPPRRDPETMALVRYYRLTATALVTTAGRGTLSPTMRLPEGLGYRPHTRVTLSVPVENQVFAQRYAHRGPAFGVLLGSSAGPHKHPDVSSWIKIFDAIRDAFPNARFYVTGVRRPSGGRSHTAGYSDQAVDELLASGPDIVDCYDIGIWNQIALLEQCDALVSPNAGFALLAVCVGTPLLTIAGGDEVEFFFNDVPFYVVLPDIPGIPYPYSAWPYVDSKIPCMRPENLERRIPDIVEGLGLLLNPDFTYAAAVKRYADNISRANVLAPSVMLPSHPLLADF